LHLSTRIRLKSSFANQNAQSQIPLLSRLNIYTSSTCYHAFRIDMKGGAMELSERCAFCRRKYTKNPRVKRQSYCGKQPCQRARRRRWQRQKMSMDTNYRMNQKDCMARWRKRNPDYWQQYRKSHMAYTLQNRLLQRFRNMNRPGRPMIAKMDTLKPERSMIPGAYYLFRTTKTIAKMDAFFQKVLIIPLNCLQPAVIAK
jgi:hypothetical protein